MEPRKRGSTSPLKVARGSIADFTPGAGAISTVWQGSERSRSWSYSWSPAKQGLNVTLTIFNMVNIYRCCSTPEKIYLILISTTKKNEKENKLGT
jgi:hypothetical protein